jgi:hypothetical protein
MKHVIKLTLVALAIFLTPATPLLHAADLASGTYLQTCTQPAMQGSTLTAVCPDSILGVNQGSALPDADYCNSTGHDIANVNGNLRCIYYWDPNGVGIISRSKDEQRDGNVTKFWRIDQPITTSPLAYYSDISFKAGDAITINAGGCVQTGGMGATWKSYTFPQGDEANTLYSGTIGIPGVVGSGGLVRIGGVLNRELRVPGNLQPPVLKQLFLRLGYQDDGYGDNGYYAHDNGNNNQCLNVSAAWVEIKIVRSLKTPDDDPHTWTPASKPFDMVWDTEDTQGLPLNPRWYVQKEKNDPQDMPDFQDTCGSAFSGGNSVDYTALEDKCTTQMPYMDLDKSPLLGWFGYCSADGFLHGHLDWAIAASTGTLFFDDWDSGIGEDDDYNLHLPRADKSLVTASDPDNSLSLEFNSDETIDQFKNSWWSGLDASVQSGNTPPPNSALGDLTNKGLPAVEIGLVGIDGVHGHGHTESHPVFALAVESASGDDNGTHDETWDFFLRNFGNEGNCSELLHYWEGLGGKYYIQLPNPEHWSDVTDVRVSSSDAYLWSGSIESGTQKGDASVVVAKDSQAMYLEVSLPAPVESGDNQGGWGVNGQVAIHYTLKSTGAHKADQKRDEHADAGHAKAGHAEAEHAEAPSAHAKATEEPEVSLDKLETKIPDAAVRQHVEQIFRAAFPGGKAPKRPSKQLTIDSVVHDHKAPAVHHGALTRPRRTRDLRIVKLNADLKEALAKVPSAKESATANPPAK